MFNIAVLQGSSRNDGNRTDLVTHFFTQVGADYAIKVFDLNEHTIAPYDYEADYDDYFQTLFIELLSYDMIVFSSPVCWYAPSAQLKLFLDRISNFSNHQQDLGRQLRGKMSATLATGFDDIVPQCFQEKFNRMFAFLSLDDLGFVYQAYPQATYQRADESIFSALLETIKSKVELLAPQTALKCQF